MAQKFNDDEGYDNGHGATTNSPSYANIVLWDLIVLIPKKQRATVGVAAWRLRVPESFCMLLDDVGELPPPLTLP